MNNNNKIKFKKTAISSAILWVLGSAQAATIYVTGNCTLVDAMAAANTDTATGSCPAGSGNDTIRVVDENISITINTIFEPSTGGSGNVGLPIVTSNMTIEGNGLTIRADNSSDNFRLFEVVTGGDLTLRDTTVTGADDGFGIGSGLLSNNGRVTLANTTFSENNGAVTLGNSFGNEILNSTIRHNIGSVNTGGLYTYLAGVNISNSGFVANKLTSNSGPLVARPGGFMRGGPGGSGPGGGASFFHSEVTINNSTFSGNESFLGGGFTISSLSPSPINSSTSHFSKNSLRGVMQNKVTLSNSTVTGNDSFVASGIYNIATEGTLTVQGSIIAGNKERIKNYYGYEIAPNIYNSGGGDVVLDGNNIIGDLGQPGVNNVVLGASDQSFSNSTEDNLYPLTLSNGQLLHPLKVGSAAIDGNDLSCFNAIVDQEGKGRGIDGDANGTFICDVGSFEHSLPIIANGAPCDLISAIVSANYDASVNGCQPGHGHDIIVLPENSTQTFDTASGIYAQGTAFGLPVITTGISLEGNNSLIERDTSVFGAFNLFLIEEGGQLNLIDSTVTGSNGELAAVTAWFGGNVKLINSTITANQSVGMLDIFSINSAVINSTISSNTLLTGSIGGNFSSGLVAYFPIGFQLSRSTISNNSDGAIGGADFRYSIQGRITNSTISNNTGNYYGGLFVVGNNNQINAITVTGNSGNNVGGMVVAAGSNNPAAANNMGHSIISGNSFTPPPVAGDASPLLTKRTLLNHRGGPPLTVNELFVIDNGLLINNFNILGQNGDSGTDGVTLGVNDMIPAGATNTVIETNLANNGGDTFTHLPVAGGIAVDGGNDYCGLTEDQRGSMRPQDGNGDGDKKCDVGAVEYVSDIIFKDGFDAQIIISRK